MKIKICMIYIVGLISGAQAVLSPGTTDIDKFVSSIVNKGPKVICGRGSILKGPFSKTAVTVRSGNGMFCLNPVISAWAELVCPDMDSSYVQSKCHNLAQSTLNGQPPLDVLSQKIKSNNPNYAHAKRWSKMIICAPNSSNKFAQLKSQVCP